MSFFGKTKRFGMWLISPYIFSKQDMNPFKGISQPFNAVVEKERSTTDGMDVVEKELNRQKGIIILRKRRLLAFLGLVGWLVVVFGGFINAWFPFPFAGMVAILKYLYLFIFVSMLIMVDYQLVLLSKNRKLGFIEYVRCRLGQ